MSNTDKDMLEKWLSNVKEDSFQQGIEYACDNILSLCDSESMPILLSYGDDSFYVSLDTIKRIIRNINVRE